jgi:hypothetical protein
MAKLADATKDLTTASRLLIRRLLRAHPNPAEAEPDAAAFEAEARALLTAAPPGLIASFDFFTVPCSQAPWFDTGLYFEKGAHLTTLAVGRTWLARSLDIWVGAHFQLWFRIGDTGEAFRGTRRTHSFSALEAGRLHLASYFPGEWSDREGHLATDPKDYRRVQGTLTVLVIRWQDPPETALPRLAATGDVDGMLAGEQDRLANPPASPKDWSYLWTLGPAEIFHDKPPPSPARHIMCRTCRDVGILRKPVSMPLTAATRLTWRWRIDALPSTLREDTIPTHDYLSIAVEFDDGQDLSYYWSAALSPGTIYRCPLPTWKNRETHMVLRSGPSGLGKWLTESRLLQTDYASAIGSPPARIVAVWLIANSLFQRREGICEYADITIETPDEIVAVS